MFVVYTILQIACIEREWPPFMQWHWIWLTPSYIEYIALTTAVPFNTGHPSVVSRSRQLKAALRVFSHYKVPLTFRYSWKRLRKRRSKNLIKFPQVYIAFVLQYVHCFEKKNTYGLNESWETRLPKRLKCTIVQYVTYTNSLSGYNYLFFIKTKYTHGMFNLSLAKWKSKKLI